MSIKLKKHNEEAYKKIIEVLKKSNRIAVIHPTGTGKSFLALKFIEDNKSKKALYIGPSKAILHNVKKNILDSDMDMSDFPNLKRILYQNLMNLSDEEIEKLDYDIIILDEFHHCGAPEWGNGVARLLNRNPNAQVIGLSATPIRYFDQLRNMAEELFGDNIASEISLEEAINKGILPKAKYVSAIYEHNEDLNKMKINIEKIKNPIKRKMAQEMFERLSKILDENTKNLPTLLSEHMTNKNGKYIVFCKNIEDMNEKLEQVQIIFGEVNSNIKTYAVSSKLKENEKMLTEFENDDSKDKLKLMFSVDMLNEGYHINDLDGVVMMRPTYSPTVYAQQLGRALTVKEENENEPVVIDLVNNFDSIKIIEDLYEKLKAYETNNEKVDNNKRQSSISIYDATKEFREIAQKITELSMINKNKSVPLQEKIEIFERFNKTGEEINGQTIYEGYPIGSWAIQIRSSLNNGRNNVTEEQFEKLSNLGILERRFENTIDEKIDAIIKWTQKHPGITVIRTDIFKSRDRSLLNKLKEFSENNNEEINQVFEEYKSIQRYYEYLCVRHGQGKLTEEQIKKCKEANLGERFGISNEIIDFSSKHQIKLDIVMEIYKEFGNYDNFISLYKEGKLTDGQLSRYNYYFINNVIDVDFSPNSENYFELLKSIFGEVGFVNNELNIYSSRSLENEIEKLDETDKKVIQERYGLIDGKVKTLNELASYFNVSGNSIRQREVKVLKHLRNSKISPKIRILSLTKLMEEENFSKEEKEELKKLINDIWHSELSFKHSKEKSDYLNEEQLKEYTERFYKIDKIREKWHFDEEKHSIHISEILKEGEGKIEDPAKINIESLNLSVRAYNCLKRLKIKSLEDLTSKTYDEIKGIRNLGKTSIDEIVSTIEKLGFTLKGKILSEEISKESMLDKYINGDIDASEISINDIDFSVRAANCLRLAEIVTLKDLINIPEEEIIGIRNMGQVTFKEIKSKIEKIQILKEKALASEKKESEEYEENNDYYEDHEKNIKVNNQEIKDKLIQDILIKQKIISKQQKKINRLKKQKELKYDMKERN